MSVIAILRQLRMKIQFPHGRPMLAEYSEARNQMADLELEATIFTPPVSLHRELYLRGF